MKVLFALCLILAALAISARAQEQLRVELDMNSLPSEQGWIFANTDHDENEFFHVDGSALYQSSGDLWGLNTGVYYYHRLAAYSGAPNWSLMVRTRVLSTFPPEEINPLGFAFILSLDGFMAGFAIAPRSIRLAGESESRPHSGNEWHTYSVLASLRAGTYSLYIDGVYFDTLPLPTSVVNDVRIGDHTNSGWASGEISHVTVVLSNSTVVANEPETWGGVKALYR
jgi:hypothetical protein